MLIIKIINDVKSSPGPSEVPNSIEKVGGINASKATDKINLAS